MAVHRVDEFLLLINQQIAYQEKIEVCLWKLEALISVTVLTDAFRELPEIILHNYCSVVIDLLEEATKSNQESLNNLHLKI